jgi:hypothetical protein
VSTKKVEYRDAEKAWYEAEVMEKQQQQRKALDAQVPKP